MVRHEITTAEAPAEHAALAKLSGTCGLTRARVHPHTDVLQLVTYDGEYLGRIRLAEPHAQRSRWIAIPASQVQTLGSYPSVKAAARALARGRQTRVNRLTEQGGRSWSST